MLKQLELHGFKSFADKTAFDFSTGITGVVGPNGSGKSNVVDSIKWILGDQSASSLRGKSMSDVIFNGAKGRSGSPFAEATLTFCNESGFLPTEMKEVRVGRRLWRSGDSEYLINGEVTRLKDVRNLFMGTGAGASSYCIIEQGRVGQILQTNASSRRSVFEEAAGISRYQSRRAEALRKLDRVEQHIARLSDIVEEADSRLNAVRNQAAKAAKYREIHTEFKALWVGLAADEYRRVSKRQQALAEEIDQLNASIAVINSEQEGLEAERTEAEVALTKVEERLKERERGRNDLQSKIASLRTTVRHEHTRLEETEQELDRLRLQRSLLKARTSEAANEMQRTQQVLENEQASVAQLRERLESAEERYSDFERAITNSSTSLEADRNSLMDQLQKNSALELRLTTTRKSRETAIQQIQRLTTAHDELRQRLAACDERYAQLEASVDALEGALTTADDSIQAMRNERENLLAQQSAMQVELTQLREDRTNHEARAAVLEDLERRYEGLRIGTREILKRAKRDDCEPWTSIVGGVNELLDVDLDKAALLEVALSDRAQLIVVRDMDLFIEHINSGRCQLEGRVGFVSLADIRNSQFFSSPWRPADAELPDLSLESGVVCAAADLARCHEETPRLATHLLGDTWVVETLNDAIYLSDKTRRRCRFVTLQGELVESDGTLFAGIELSSSSVLTRRSELRQLGDDIDRIGSEIESRQQVCSRVADEVAGIEAKLEAALAETRARSDSLTQLRADFSQVAGERDRLRRERRELLLEREKLVRQDCQFDRELTDTQQVMESGLTHAMQLKEQLARAENTLITSRQQLESLTAERNQAEIALGKQEERFNAMHGGLQRLESDLQQRILQEEEADRRAHTGAQRRQETTFRILAATSELADLHLGSEQILENVRTEAAELRHLKANRAGVAARESALATQRRELATRLHEVQMEQGTLNHQLESTAGRIEDEFQFPLVDAVESGVSAMAAHVIPPLVGGEESEREGHLPADSISEEDADDHDVDREDHAPDEAVAGEDEVIDAVGIQGEESAEGEHDSDETGWLVNEDESPNDGETVESDIEQPEESDAESPKLTAVEQLDDDEFEDLRAELEDRVERLRRRLRKMGNVSTESLENLEELESRFGGLSYQLKDLIHARDTLEAIVRRINAESKRLFAETFECIRGHFKDLFRKLFGGGEGDVILEDPDDVLECGIDIVARPPGKELRSISLLSGGEKTMTAVALLLAIFRSRPSPFCILDEVDAALDEANVDRFVQVLREFQETTQFIMITHRKPSMSVCDLIFGVTMQESGVSKRLTVRFEDVNDNGDFIVPDEKQDAA